MREDNNEINKYQQQPYNFKQNSTFNISSLTAVDTSVSPPKQPMFSPRNLMSFLSKNIEQISSPRDFMQTIQQNFRAQKYTNKTISPYTADEIHKQFHIYLDGIDKNISIYKNSSMKKIKEMKQVTNNKQILENQVRLSRIPKQYFQEWCQEQQRDNDIDIEQKDQQVRQQVISQMKPFATKHLLSKKLQLLMIPSIQVSTLKKKSRINLRQKQQQLAQYLDQIQLIIFTKARKYPQKYMCYLNNITSADQQIQHTLLTIGNFRSSTSSKLIKISQKYRYTKVLMQKQQNLKKILKLINCMRIIKLQKMKSLDTTNLQGSLLNQNIMLDQHSLTVMIQNKDSVLYKIRSITKMLANLQEIHKKIKQNRLRAMKKQLEEIIKKIIVTYDRQDWLRSQLPKNVIKKQLQAKADIKSTQINDKLDNSYLNVSVLDQSYCMGSVKAGGSSNNLKLNNIKIITGIQQRKQNLRKQWQSYCQQYYETQESSSDLFLQNQQEILGELVLKQLLRHNGAFSRDIQDYLTLVYSQKNLIQQAQTHPQRLFYLQPKFFNKILILYYDAVKSVIKFFNNNFINLKQTQQKILQFLKSRIDDFINVRKINSTTQFDEVVIMISGTFDYWLADPAFIISQKIVNNDKFAQIKNHQIKSQQQWQEYLINKKIKCIEEYISTLHENNLVNKIKLQIQVEKFEAVSISSEYFLAFDYILNWGQQTNRTINSNKLLENGDNYKLDLSLSILGDIDNTVLVNSKPVFSIFKIIDKVLIIEGIRYKVMKSFFVLLVQIQAYLKVKSYFPELTKKIDEKICQSIGFYSWYSKKIFMNKNTIKKRTLKAFYLFKQVCLLLKKILDILNIQTVPKKLNKLDQDLTSILDDLDKQIGLHAFMQVQEQVSKLYESRLKLRKQIPTTESMRIIDILDKARIQSSQFQASPEQSLKNTIKMICKNYFGYLVNMEARGRAELKWFLPKFRQTVGDIFNDDIVLIERKFAQK